MLIADCLKKDKVVEALLAPESRAILSLTISAPKSVAEISEELGMSARSVYRHADELCKLGLLAAERRVLIYTGGKYAMYRSLVKSVTFTYDGDKNLCVDLVPNKDILEKFMRFWTRLGE